MPSEIARLRAQIDEEAEAMQRGLSGLSAGSALHQFIEMKMRRLGDCQERLAAHLGRQEATRITCEIYFHHLEGG